MTLAGHAGPVTYTGAPSVVSGRITGLAVAPNCVPGRCVVLVASAGGGVWRTRDALAAMPQWQSVSLGLPTTAIGSIAFDPNDSSAQTVYVGTGEANGSSDSEAGLGLFKSDDQGDSWDLVPGSQAVANDRAIPAVAIDPADPRLISFTRTLYAVPHGRGIFRLDL